MICLTTPKNKVWQGVAGGAETQNETCLTTTPIYRGVVVWRGSVAKGWARNRGGAKRKAMRSQI